MTWKPSRRVLATLLVTALMLVAGCTGPADNANASGNGGGPAVGQTDTADGVGVGGTDTAEPGGATTTEDGVMNGSQTTEESAMNETETSEDSTGANETSVDGGNETT